MWARSMVLMSLLLTACAPQQASFITPEREAILDGVLRVAVESGDVPGVVAHSGQVEGPVRGKWKGRFGASGRGVGAKRRWR